MNDLIAIPIAQYSDTKTSNTISNTNQPAKEKPLPTGKGLSVTAFLADYIPATRQALEADPTLINLYDLEHELGYRQDIKAKLLTPAHHSTAMPFDAPVSPDNHRIPLVLQDNQGTAVTVAYSLANGTAPLIHDPSQPCAYVIGTMQDGDTWYASDSLEEGIRLFTLLASEGEAVTVLVSLNAHQLIQMARHFAEVHSVLVNVTAEHKDRVSKQLKGANVTLLVTVVPLVELVGIEGGSVRELVASVERVDLSTIAFSHLKEPPIPHNGGYIEHHEDGIYYVTYTADLEIKHKTFVSAPLEVIAKSHDENSHAWGMVLRWQDEANISHQWSMPREYLQGDCREYRKILVSRGLKISTLAKAQQALDAYLNNHPVSKTALCVSKLGWHHHSYVTPNHTYGQSDRMVVYQPDHPVNHGISSQGTLADWQNHVSKPMAEQSRVAFSIACAFAGQLLHLLGAEGGGFHIVGSSTMGKSIALKVAGSVWGNPEQFIKRWRATDNGLETIASTHNDGFLGLDEIGEAEPKIVGKSAYMLANGQGKVRNSASGANRPTLTWRIIFLSNGEHSLESYLRQAGITVNAGQEVRLCHIDADAGQGFKIFDSIVMGDNGEAQSTLIKDNAMRYYGTAGIAWLEYLTSQVDSITSQAKQLQQAFMSHYAHCRGQAHRVANRFALVACAGELATQAGITGWQVGQATNAVRVCFDNWLSHNGSDGNHEARKMLEHLQGFIEKNASSRFEQWDNVNKWTMEAQRVANRVGVISQDGSVFYFLPNVFAEVCSPFDKSAMLAMLNQAGLLITNENRMTAKIRLPASHQGLPNRFYAVKSQILNSGNEFLHGNSGNTGNIE